MSDQPLLGVGAVAIESDRLLLVQRGRAPEAGRWALPGGRVEAGELLAEAVVREVYEETALEGVCGPFVGLVERFYDEGHIVILDFEVTVLDPHDPVAGDDAMGAAWIPLEDVGELDLAEGLAAFLHEHGIIDTIA